MPDPRDALEAALVANPDDLALHAAYADLLVEQGDPRGEFIQVQLALEDPARSPEERKALRRREEALLAAHARTWLGPLGPCLLDRQGLPDYLRERLPRSGHFYQFQYRRGWLESLHLPMLTVAIARALLQTRGLSLLRRLVIEEALYEGQEDFTPGEDVDPRPRGGGGGWYCMSLLARAEWVGHLRVFQLGGLDPRNCGTGGQEAVTLVRKMPELEELRLYAHCVNTTRLFALPLPRLRVLHVHHVHQYPLEILADNPTLGRLEELSLWPHALEPHDESAYITLEGVRALVHSPHLRSLAHLTLHLSDLGDEGCWEIARSGILGRLKVLDISRGRVTDVGASVLAADPALPRLERLNVSQNQLTPAGVAALAATGVRLEAADQLEPWQIEEGEHLWDGDME